MGASSSSGNGEATSWSGLLSVCFERWPLLFSYLILIADETLNKEYLPVLGYEPLASAATRMLLGADSSSWKEGRATGIQCLSGTGALRVGADFLARISKYSVVYSSNPTWGNCYIT